MVSLSAINASCDQIPTTLPAGLVAIFVGATSGIGETTVKQFARYAVRPRVYIIGRNQDAADRIMAECKAFNPDGEFSFIKADMSLIRSADALSQEIKARETTLNLLFMSAGDAIIDKSKSPEGLHILATLYWYSRIRLVQNLLPLLHQASSLRRVVSVGAAGFEGDAHFDPDDIQGLRVPLEHIREHLATVATLGFEALTARAAREQDADGAGAGAAPWLSIVHDYPGTVVTPLTTRMLPPEMLRETDTVPLEECGRRHLFLATSARYPAAASEVTSGRKDGGEGGSRAVPLVEGLEVAVGSNGRVGSGAYSVGADCESADAGVLEKLAGLREKGMVDVVWEHTQAEFRRIERGEY